MKKAIWAAAILALAAILQIAVPPFQSPDEPHHFAAILMAARGGDSRDWAEKETIKLMDRHDWWRPAGVGRPETLPERISDVTFLMDGAQSDDFLIRLNGYLLFHKALGRILRPLGVDKAERLYWICRFVSLAFYLIAIYFLFLALRLLAGLWKIPIIQGVILAAFLPQFALTSTSVSPDAFILCLGSIFIWGAIRLIVQKGPTALVPLLVVIAGAGFLSDRSGFFMAALLLALPLFIARRKNWQDVVVGTIFFAVLGILLLYAAAMYFPLSVERSVLTLKGVLDNAGKAVPQLLSPDRFQVQYWLFLIDTFFLRFGWLAFGAPAWIAWLWRIAVLAMAGGFAAYAIDGIRRRWRGSRGELEKKSEEKSLNGASGTRVRILLFAILGIALQVVGMWVYYGSNGIFTQGRYLFPLMTSLMLIGIIGLHKLGSLIQPKRGGAIVLASSLVLEIFFLSYVVLAWILPKFNLTVQGHYPGI